jgi:hypothetical protein
MNLNKPSCLFLRKTNRGIAMFSALLSFKKKRTMLWVMSGLRAVVLLKRSSNQHTVNACPEPQTYSKHVRGLRLADKCDPEVDDTGGVWVVGRIPKEIAQSSTPRSSRS